MRSIIIIAILSFFSYNSNAQAVEEDQLGAWYMYFYNENFGDSQFGVQGDLQFRFWDFGSDLEQILVRSGFTYRPKNADVKITLGYGNITSGVPGDSSDKSSESRIYQEFLLPHKVAPRIALTHRFRYEQRFVEGQDFRTRYRYNLFLTVPLNSLEMKQKTVYLSLYNELFINGQRDIGDGATVQLFDRNRTYIGVGYGLTDKLRLQLGWMKQTTNSWSKDQAQLSLHQNW